MTERHNTAEGGANGQAVTVANSGGASGDPFDYVAANYIGYAGAPAIGAASYKISNGNSAAGEPTGNVRWDVLDDTSRIGLRVSVYLPSPGVIDPLYNPQTNPNSNGSIAQYFGSTFGQFTCFTADRDFKDGTPGNPIVKTPRGLFLSLGGTYLLRENELLPLDAWTTLEFDWDFNTAYVAFRAYAGTAPGGQLLAEVGTTIGFQPGRDRARGAVIFGGGSDNPTPFYIDELTLNDKGIVKAAETVPGKDPSCAPFLDLVNEYARAVNRPVKVTSATTMVVLAAGAPIPPGYVAWDTLVYVPAENTFVDPEASPTPGAEDQDAADQTPAGVTPDTNNSVGTPVTGGPGNAQQSPGDSD